MSTKPKNPFRLLSKLPVGSPEYEAQFKLCAHIMRQYGVDPREFRKAARLYILKGEREGLARKHRDTLAMLNFKWEREQEYLLFDRVHGKSTASHEGFVPADTLALDGVSRTCLSKAKRAGKLPTRPAPPGMRDSQGKAVRILYHEITALRICKGQRVRKKQQRRPPNRPI